MNNYATQFIRILAHGAAWTVLIHSMTGTAAGTETLFGHRAYQVVSESRLVPVGKYRTTGRVVKTLPPAAIAFKKMQEAAHREGVSIIPISGFRTGSYQQKLFANAVKRYGSKEGAARWVAPPGYSEHHTGLALDIGDEAHLECDVESCFERTPAYDWLKKNAARFGFELSFPPGNARISFEPWHWRFGDF
jgi:LAS superfamily LD-carboxypeptidase LdcB